MELPMKIEINDCALEARIQKQIQATGAARGAVEALLRLLENAGRTGSLAARKQNFH